MTEYLFYADEIDINYMKRVCVTGSSLSPLPIFIKDNNSKKRQVFASGQKRKQGAEHSNNLLAQLTRLSQWPT